MTNAASEALPTEAKLALVLADAAAPLDELKHSLGLCGVPACYCLLEDWPQLAAQPFHLIVLDVAAYRLVEVLRQLRGVAAYAAVPLLVTGARYAADESLAGVLPSYRAMPCPGGIPIALLQSLLGQALPPAHISRLF